MPAHTDAPAQPSLRPPASCAELFRVFNRVALQAFGGAIAMAQIELVERARWFSPAQFVDLLSLAQALPGPNVVNLAVIVGDRAFGWRGAGAAMAGMLVLPLALVLLAAALIAQHADVLALRGALRGMGLVAAALVIATALKLARSQRHNPLGLPMAGALAAATWVAIALLRWPMAWVVPGLGSLALAVAWWRLRR